MVARMMFPYLLMIVLPDIYLDYYYLRHRFKYGWRQRLLWLTPGILMTIYTIILSTIRNFVPNDLRWITFYIALIGLFVFPKFLFAVCSFIGHIFCRLVHGRRNWGNVLGILLALWGVYIFFAGYTYGFRQLKVNHVNLYFKDLPAAFDGYRITHISDLHVGTFTDKRANILKRDIDSVNAQGSDLIVFTGDLENVQPSEIYPVTDLLSSLKARDGVISVLGNHDYSHYIKAEPAVRVANERELQSLERQFGWRLLLNEHTVVKRGNDSIFIAGEENDGQPPFPQRANLGKTLQGIPSNAFVVMLQHDPSAWRRDILPNSHCQLTLSGHTHGGQISVMGVRLTKFYLGEDVGLYSEGDRYLYVNVGLGGLLPYRYKMPAEITVITLHKKS